jgi:hypothetical protein
MNLFTSTGLFENIFLRLLYVALKVKELFLFLGLVLNPNILGIISLSVFTFSLELLIYFICFFKFLLKIPFSFPEINTELD